MAGESRTTTDHATIRKWAESRGGRPASVKGTGNGDAGLLRIEFPGYGREGSLQQISWDEFFRKFDAKNLAFLYQEETRGGGQSRFFKLVSRAARNGGGRNGSREKSGDGSRQKTRR